MSHILSTSLTRSARHSAMPQQRSLRWAGAAYALAALLSAACWLAIAAAIAWLASAM